ncbi:MAG: MGMT family protein [Haloplanus sp.]
MEGLYARESSVLGRAVQVAVVSGRVIGVEFPESTPPDAAADHPLLDRLFDYLDGAEDDFDDVTVALTLPTDQREVLEAVRKVPYGETADVGQVARLAHLDADDADDVETVRAALRANPAPIFVPDHRVSEPGATPADVADRLRDLEG